MPTDNVLLIILATVVAMGLLVALTSRNRHAVEVNVMNGAYPLRPGVDLLLYVRRDVKR